MAIITSTEALHIKRMTVVVRGAPKDFIAAATYAQEHVRWSMKYVKYQQDAQRASSNVKIIHNKAGVETAEATIKLEYLSVGGSEDDIKRWLEARNLELLEVLVSRREVFKA